MREWPDFRFKLDLYGGKGDVFNPYSALGITWLDRWCARVVCQLIWRSGAKSFQFGGYTGIHGSYQLVMADRFQLMHWILRTAGYDCCPADVSRRCGLEPEEKSGANGCLMVIQESENE